MKNILKKEANKLRRTKRKDKKSANEMIIKHFIEKYNHYLKGRSGTMFL
jgi:hypothetical protein